MKHGISPTTDRRVLKRRGKYIHVSKPLAIKETDWATGALKGIVSYDPDYLAPPNVRVNPDRGGRCCKPGRRR